MKKRHVRMLAVGLMMLSSLVCSACSGKPANTPPASSNAAGESQAAGEEKDENKTETKDKTETKKLKIVSQLFYEPQQLQYVKEDILSQFTEETGIEVEFQVVSDSAELFKMLETQKSTGNWTTDILIAHDSTAVQTVKEYGAVEPYDFEPEGTYITQLDDNFVIDGERYYVPLQIDCYLLIANREALPYLDKLGYDVNDLTWEQLAEWCNLIKEETGEARYVFPALPGNFAVYETSAIQLSYGADYVPVFNTESSKKAYDVLSSMKDAILPSSSTIDYPTVPLVSGEAWITVFHQGYANSSYGQSPDKFIVAPVPKGDTGIRGTIAGGHGIGIIAGSPNQEAAREFVEFFLRDDIMYDMMKETGPWIPSKKEITDQLGDDASDEIMKAGIAILEGDTKLDRVRADEFEDWALVKGLYEETFADLMKGKAIDQAYLDAKQEELEKIRVK